MKKLFFLLFPIICFSQSDQLTISEIDSIINKSRPNIELSGIIKHKRKTIGGFGKTIYKYKENLIYSYYNESTKNKDYEFFHFYKFYFYNEKPTTIDINIERTNLKNNSTEEFKIILNEIEANSFKEIENPFQIDLRMKINRLIFDFINFKFPE